MALTFQWVEDPNQFPRRVSKTTNGVAVTRTGLVTGTRDPDIALTAAGLPPMGEPYGAKYPTLRVVDVAAEPLGGTSDSSGGESNGSCRVTVTYGEPGRGSTPPPPDGSGSNFTEVKFGSASVPVQWGWNYLSPPDLDDDATPTFGPLNNGDGSSLEVSVMSLEVTVYYQSLAAFDWRHAARLATLGALNDAAVTLPKIKDTGWVWRLDAGQLKYRGFSTPVKRAGRSGVDYWEVTHSLELREDWDEIDQIEDERGVPIASRKSTVHRRGSFNGLW
mgnify:FL=1